MDFSKFKTNDWLIIGGGAGMLIFGLALDWAKIESFGISVSDGNAFDWFRGWFSWLLVIGAAVVTVLRVTEKLDDKLPWPIILIGATGLASLLMLFLIITGPDKEGVDLGRGIGLWLSAISTFVATAGAVMSFTAAGGDLKDLTDPNKLKSAFDSDRDGDAAGEMPPPPPPAGS